MESILLSVTYLPLALCLAPQTIRERERTHRLTLTGNEKKRLTKRWFIFSFFTFSLKMWDQIKDCIYLCRDNIYLIWNFLFTSCPLTITICNVCIHVCPVYLFILMNCECLCLHRWKALQLMPWLHVLRQVIYSFHIWFAVSFNSDFYLTCSLEIWVNKIYYWHLTQYKYPFICFTSGW